MSEKCREYSSIKKQFIKCFQHASIMLGATKMEELQINISRISVAQKLDILQK